MPASSSSSLKERPPQEVQCHHVLTICPLRLAERNQANHALCVWTPTPVIPSFVILRFWRSKPFSAGQVCAGHQTLSEFRKFRLTPACEVVSTVLSLPSEGVRFSSSLPRSAPSMLSISNRLLIAGPAFFGFFSAPIALGRYVLVGSGTSHSSRTNSILQPLYVERLIMHVRAKSALWMLFVETYASLPRKTTSMMTRLWMCSMSSRIRASVRPLSSAERMRMLRVAPLAILLLMCALRWN